MATVLHHHRFTHDYDPDISAGVAVLMAFLAALVIVTAAALFALEFSPLIETPQSMQPMQIDVNGGLRNSTPSGSQY